MYAHRKGCACVLQRVVQVGGTLSLALIQRRRHVVRLVTAVFGVLAPISAHAHLVSTGLGPVYDGVLHFAMSPQAVIPTVALSLLAGLNGPAHARATLFALPAAWLLAAGAVLGVAWSAPTVTAEWLTAGSLLVAGSLLAARIRLPQAAICGLAVGLGVVCGLLSGGELIDQSGFAGPLAGTVAAAFCTVSLAASLPLALERTWAVIALRVGGSWIAAAGLLLVGRSVQILQA